MRKTSVDIDEALIRRESRQSDRPHVLAPRII